ncbi:hypothetical protein CSKR_100830 [Clonorchis sinensis]|uniref:Uncharacterized protein n=1 Tax=Clonorchis sinensis TaxID=79923 RepID=A0A419QFW6_CLOSI|nr:hypothetical protein CSKR_100830 [Clonorchis sinensis]
MRILKKQQAARETSRKTRDPKKLCYREATTAKNASADGSGWCCSEAFRILLMLREYGWYRDWTSDYVDLPRKPVVCSHASIVRPIQGNDWQTASREKFCGGTGASNECKVQLRCHIVLHSY